MFQFGGLELYWGGYAHERSSVATGLGLGQVLSKLSLAMYPFSISIDEHVPLKFLVTKRLWKITRMYLAISI